MAQYWSRYEPNLGDALSPVFTAELLQLQPRWVTRGFGGKLLGMGSIARHVGPADVVAGSGAITADSIDLTRRATVRWVRGPLTRRCLGTSRVPELYGDPGLLLPDVLMNTLGSVPVADPSTDLVGVIPHFADRHLQSSSLIDEGTVMLNILGSLDEFIGLLMQCRVVVSSSLHGIVFAEALGIPALWVTPSPEIKGGRFKFDDYYLGTHREGVQPLDIRDALDKARGDDLAAPVFDLDPLRRGVQQLRVDLAEQIVIAGRAGENALGSV